MPIYEYKCKLCDDRFEIEQRISDDALTTLSGCNVADDGAHALKKIFSSIGISFKGDGFYRNDARGSSSRSAKSTDKPSETSSSEKSSDTSSSSSSSESAKSSNGSAGSSSDSGPAKAATTSD